MVRFPGVLIALGAMMLAYGALHAVTGQPIGTSATAIQRIDDGWGAAIVDVWLLERVEAHEVRVGDLITYQFPWFEFPVTREVVAIHDVAGSGPFNKTAYGCPQSSWPDTPGFVTRGDGNRQVDQCSIGPPVRQEWILGRPVGRVPAAGAPVLLVENSHVASNVPLSSWLALGVTGAAGAGLAAWRWRRRRAAAQP